MTQLVSYIRDFLHDPEGERWSDSRILYLINQAQIDLARKANAVRDIYTLVLKGDVEIYDLPKDYIKLLRVEINGCNVPIVSHSKLDNAVCTSDCWHDRHGRPIAAMVDMMSRDKIKFYPIPDKDIPNSGIATNSYGLFTNIPNAVNNVGIIANADQDFTRGDISATGFGVTADIQEFDNICTIHYTRLPRPVTSLQDSLEIDSINESAIKYYVCGHLLRQDKDDISRSLGKEELSLYNEELRQLHKESSLDFTNGTHYSTDYRRL